MFKTKNPIGCASKKSKKNEKGFSLLEVLPLIIVMTSLFGFLMGLWGMTHKHILHGISSRNYAFETFNHRANLIYFSDSRATPATNLNSYEESEVRWHASGDGRGNVLRALTTPIRFPAGEDVGSNEPPRLHRQDIFQDRNIPAQGEGTEDGGTVLPWVLVSHGICINTNCGGGE